MITADTNVLVYLFDDRDPAKQAAAGELLRAMEIGDRLLGLQVIGELQNVLRRKLGQPPWEAAQNARNLLELFDVYCPTEVAGGEALTLMASGRLSYWDGLLLASAREAGVTVMLSEDMQDGARFGSITVVNPFGEDGLSARAREVLEL